MEMISRSLLTFLLNSLWQIPLVAAAAAITCRLLRKSPATYCHAVWVAALAASLLLPAASIRRAETTDALPQFDVPVASQDMTIPKTASDSAVAPFAGIRRAPAPRTISLAATTSSILLGAYLLFILFRLAGLVRASIQTLRLRRQALSRELPLAMERVFSRSRDAFSIKDVKLLFSDKISGPVTAGCAIILPELLLAEPSEDVLTTAIGHEMAHLARCDFICNLVYELLHLPVSFHPAAWLIRRGIHRTREMACDEMVAGRLLDAGVYARSMVSIATAMMSVPSPGYTLGVFDGDILEERVRRLLERPVASLKRARLLLAGGFATLVLCAVLASSLSLTARAQGAAGDMMRNGHVAYNTGDYKTAAADFEAAVRLEPDNLEAKLLLAKSVMQQFVPGSNANGPLAAARRQYLDVLARDPKNQRALHGMMIVASDMLQHQEAYEWAQKAISADSSDATAYYTIGVLDWQMSFPAYMKARQAAGMFPQDPGIISDAGLRQNFRTEHMSQIEDGLRMLQMALQIEPDYSNAMAYMNLLYRIESGVADTAAESQELVSTADGWVEKALAAQRTQAQNTAQAGGPPPDRADAPLMAPPPLPPPPPPPGMAGARVRVNEPEQQARLLKQTPPVYPDSARQAGITGTVTMHVLIGPDGAVKNITIASGPRQLVIAAMEAVRTWTYQPLILNGHPTEVETTVSLNFPPQ